MLLAAEDNVHLCLDSGRSARIDNRHRLPIPIVSTIDQLIHPHEPPVHRVLGHRLGIANEFVTTSIDGILNLKVNRGKHLKTGHCDRIAHAPG